MRYELREEFAEHIISFADYRENYGDDKDTKEYLSKLSKICCDYLNCKEEDLALLCVTDCEWEYNVTFPRVDQVEAEKLDWAWTRKTTIEGFKVVEEIIDGQAAWVMLKEDIKKVLPLVCSKAFRKIREEGDPAPLIKERSKSPLSEKSLGLRITENLEQFRELQESLEPMGNETVDDLMTLELQGREVFADEIGCNIKDLICVLNFDEDLGELKKSFPEVHKKLIEVHKYCFLDQVRVRTGFNRFVKGLPGSGEMYIHLDKYETEDGFKYVYVYSYQTLYWKQSELVEYLNEIEEELYEKFDKEVVDVFYDLFREIL